ncbi:hypothetical protein B0A48_15352 [Cryoendolithus antarcticus]|uniref:Uncharacterized protein n=1 Tax=Cryoendolithus antarcticus TaxID=1507870 RepID=A0A1V8SHS1_9PEZI|nr:hypothetical protein B0A48_15352 [Cryoendolithus antarcticus]
MAYRDSSPEPSNRAGKRWRSRLAQLKTHKVLSERAKRLKQYMLETKYAELYARWSEQLPEESKGAMMPVITTDPRLAMVWQALLEQECKDAQERYAGQYEFGKPAWKSNLTSQPLHGDVWSAGTSVTGSIYNHGMFDEILTKPVDRKVSLEDETGYWIKRGDWARLGEQCNKDLAATNHIFDPVTQTAEIECYREAIRQFRDTWVLRIRRDCGYCCHVVLAYAQEQRVEVAGMKEIASARLVGGKIGALKAWYRFVHEKDPEAALELRSHYYFEDLILEEARLEAAREVVDDKTEDLRQVCAAMDHNVPEWDDAGPQEAAIEPEWDFETWSKERDHQELVDKIKQRDRRVRVLENTVKQRDKSIRELKAKITQMETGGVANALV